MKIKTLKGQIKVITGLHIGAGSTIIEIGGMDNPIIKNPHTGEPYIPGSSIKGKMRSLMEWALGTVHATNGEPCACGKADCKVCRVFGTGSSSNQKTIEKTKGRGPTRLIVRDAMLSEESRSAFLNDKRPYFEEKSENSINRITALAMPRPIERVVPGTLFDFNLSYRIIDMGDGETIDETYFAEVVLQALAMLEKDYLGGGGSRGNGQIEFVGLKDSETDEQYQLSNYLKSK